MVGTKALETINRDHHLGLAQRKSMVGSGMDLQPYLAWFDAHLTAARAIAPDLLLLVSAVEALIIAFFFVAWSKAVRRVRALARAKVGLDADLGEVSKALEKEIMWRLAAEAPGVRVMETGSGLTPKPPRELQELLAKENFDPNPTTAKIAPDPQPGGIGLASAVDSLGIETSAEMRQSAPG